MYKMLRPHKRVADHLSAILVVSVPEKLSRLLLAPVEILPYRAEGLLLRIRNLRIVRIAHTDPTCKEFSGVGESLGVAFVVIDQLKTVHKATIEIIGGHVIRDFIISSATEIVRNDGCSGYVKQGT